MAIAISSEGTGGTVSDGSGNFSVTKPGTVNNGDVLVVVVGLQANTIIVPPVGWTTGNQNGSASGNDVRGGIFYKIVNVAADEPASYTFTIGASQQVGWWIGSLSGLAIAIEDVAFSGAGAWVNKQNDTSPNCPAVTTVTNEAMALACWVVNSDSVKTQPGGSWLARADDVGGNGCLNVASQIFPTAGTSTGTPEITDVAASQESEVGMFVFRPGVTKEERVSHAGAYVEASQKASIISHAGAYVETYQIALTVSHVGIYVEAMITNNPYTTKPKPKKKDGSPTDFTLITGDIHIRHQRI